LSASKCLSCTVAFALDACFSAGATVGMIPGPHPHGQLSQIPLPAPAAPQDKPNTGLPHTAPPVGVPPPTSEANLPGLSEAMLRVPFGVPPGMHPQGQCK
jgi:hypothetical protein